MFPSMNTIITIRNAMLFSILKRKIPERLIQNNGYVQIRGCYVASGILSHTQTWIILEGSCSVPSQAAHRLASLLVGSCSDKIRPSKSVLDGLFSGSLVEAKRSYLSTEEQSPARGKDCLFPETCLFPTWASYPRSWYLITFPTEFLEQSGPAVTSVTL